MSESCADSSVIRLLYTNISLHLYFLAVEQNR